MGVRVLLDEDRVFVTYHSASVFSGDDLFEEDYDLEQAWTGQSNGLCGAAVEGLLLLNVGQHTGWVPFRVELHAGEPSVDDRWEDIVDVSFRPARDSVHLAGLDGEAYPLVLPRQDYRVRYLACGLDEAQAEDGRDAYLMQLWPAPPAADRIVRQTSEQAAYWHRSHRPPTPQEEAEENRQ